MQLERKTDVLEVIFYYTEQIHLWKMLLSTERSPHPTIRSHCSQAMESYPTAYKEITWNCNNIMITRMKMISDNGVLDNGYTIV